MIFGGYFLNVAKNPTRARARKGEAQGVLSYRKVTGIFDNPHVRSECPANIFILNSHREATKCHIPKVWDHHKKLTKKQQKQNQFIW